MTNLAIDSELFTDVAEEGEASLCGGVAAGISISAFAEGTQSASSRTRVFSFGVTLPSGKKLAFSLGGGFSIGLDYA